MLEAKAQELRRQVFYEKIKFFKIFFRRSKNKKNKVFNHIFQPITRKNGLQKIFSSGLQNCAVLEDNFWWLKDFEAKAKVKNFKMFP